MAITEGSRFAQFPRDGPFPHVYEFGPYQLDVPGRQLLRAGQPVAIAPKALDLLLILLRDHRRVVSKAELMRELWAETAVEDANLTQQVFTLRKILGTTPDGAAYIDTVPRRGYRFGAEVRKGGAAEDSRGPDEGTKPAGPQQPAAGLLRGPRDSGRRRLASATAAAVVLLAGLAGVFGVWRVWFAPPSGPVTLAVLPFTVLGGKPLPADSGAAPGFADSLAVGIPEAIVTRLSSVRQFRVRPTRAASGYGRQTADVQTVGRALGSQYVLAGTVRADARHVRVNVQLVRTNDGAPVWGRQYDRTREELLAIEDTIAEEIAGALQIRISDAQRERLYRRYTRSGAAYERYLMGRARLRSITEADAVAAIAEFEAARDIDPRYALAYAGIATAAAQLRVRFASRAGSGIWDERARQAAGRALELDPDLAEAHVAIAAVHRFQEYDWDTVVRESQRALELNPSLDTAHLYLAAAYFHLGLLEDAEREVARARDVNPENRLEPFEILSAIHLYAGRMEEAAGYLSQASELTDSRIVRYLLGWTLHYRGDDRRADVLLTSMTDEEGPLAGNARATLAATRAARGARAEARALAERTASEPEINHHAAYALGATYAQLGDVATALRWLAQASATGFSCYPWYARDPLLDPIRADARFVEFMRTLRRSWESARARYSSQR